MNTGEQGCYFLFFSGIPEEKEGKPRGVGVEKN